MHTFTSTHVKGITLVLGSGGPVGHAYHAGLLRALSQVFGWDPRKAELLVGTSAGAQVAALLRAGMSAEDLCARAAGDSMSSEGESIARHYTRPDHDEPDPSIPRTLRPASSRYLREILRRPWKARPGRFFSALLPAGRVSLHPQAEGLRKLFGHEWPNKKLWIAALCLHSGKLTAFGREDAPRTDVGTAVICSGAVPSVCAPVEVEGRLFVDGGMASATNLDLLDQDQNETVIVSSPLSMIPPMRLLLRNEVRALRAKKKRVIVFEPSGEAARAMGMSPMDLARSANVARTTHHSMVRELSARRDLHEIF